MKVYNIGAKPITYTGRPQQLVRQTLEPIAQKGRDIVEELAEETIEIMGKDEATLNYLFKHLPPNTERKLEHFNGQRKISVFRGTDFMNKITQRLTDPPLTFIRTMMNAGTAENPKLKTTAVSLRIPTRPEEVLIQFLDEPQKQLFLRVTRTGFEAHKALYDSWQDLRQDRIFQKVVTTMTGKEF